ncbi:MAG: hypothetical protein RLP44_06825 [Aggregatilineales bacterium]
MIPPIIVCESDDLNIFLSVFDAESYLEFIDVENNEYIAFDSNGLCLDLGVNVETQRVIISQQSPINRRPELLRDKIEKFMRYMKVNPSWIENATLEGLIEKTVEFHFPK